MNVSCQLHTDAANLNSQVGDDGPLVTLQSLQGDLGNLSFGLPHKHLAGCSQHLFILTLNLHLMEIAGSFTDAQLLSCSRNIETSPGPTLTWAIPVTEMGTPWRV